MGGGRCLWGRRGEGDVFVVGREGGGRYLWVCGKGMEV